ncbi:MAG: PQQ-dependent catabolism-associated CXXCW motif protein [Cycloclasticus sp.]|nr:PQQ-dependent catabolism-associated CXXCW motif protein [Cycloclasticus sp.]MBQ0790456.1 PQQ-dependent catabolism-associated CXXCW motif protein [Cycloclasticus sp.]
MKRIKWLLNPAVMLLMTSSCYVANAHNTHISDEPYRGLPYHATTTEVPPKNVDRLLINEVQQLISSGDKPVLIDVYGAIFREEALDFDGAWQVTLPRQNIPNSTWLPNVGKETLIPIVELYYQQQLIRLTQENKAKTIIIYCNVDCWMAWNAAKRANEWGYTSVKWFREGVDGWIEKGLQLQEAKPINLPVDDE